MHLHAQECYGVRDDERSTPGAYGPRTVKSRLLVGFVNDQRHDHSRGQRDWFALAAGIQGPSGRLARDGRAVRRRARREPRAVALRVPGTVRATRSGDVVEENAP